MFAVLIAVLGAAAGCADILGASGPDVAVSLEPPPPAVAVRALRVAIDGYLTEVPAPAVGGARAERSLRVPGFGTKHVEVALVGTAGDTLAAVSFPQDFQRHFQYWVSGVVGQQRPLGNCIGSVTHVPLRSGAGDTLFVMAGGLPDGAIC